jgi:hypothetical protein
VSYEVIWLQTAQRQLSDLNNIPDLKWPAIHFVHWLQRELAARPLTLGESRGDGMRIVIRHPFAATYYVDKDAATVKVVTIWCFDAGGTGQNSPAN